MKEDQYVAVKCREALEELRTNGWNQNSMVRNYTDWRFSSKCLMGAIKVVTTGRPAGWVTGTTKVMIEVGKRIPDHRLIDDWNDDPDRTFEDVEAVLSATINELEQTHG